MARLDVSWQNALIATGLVVLTLYAVKMINNVTHDPITGAVRSAMA